MLIGSHERKFEGKMNILDEILKIRADPALWRNERGQIRKMLNVVDTDISKEMAVAFADHTRSVCERVTTELDLAAKPLGTFRPTLEIALHGEDSIDDIQKLRIELNTLHFALKKYSFVRCRAALAALDALELAILVCCQNQLTDAGLLKRSINIPNAYAVAYSSMHAVALEEGERSGTRQSAK